jgi:Bacterial PH domain
VRYLTDTLLDGEDVVHVARFHWLYSAWSFCLFGLWAAAGVALFWSPPKYWSWLAPLPQPQLLASLSLVAWGAAICLWRFINMWSTEIAVTSRRLVYKRGWIARHTDEIALNRLEEVNLRQSILGRIFDYGALRLAGTGIGQIELPNIEGPVAFRRALLTAQGKLQG